jgi:FlaG/FlaF family flagellin (archaellin)
LLFGRNPEEKKMLLQAADKRGLSIIIGYVLIIVISIVMSGLVYAWLKTYVPKDTGTCPEGTSMFIQQVSYNCTTKILTVSVKNNGRFGLDGYFIHASNRSDEKLATIDISNRFMGSLALISGSEVRFSNVENGLSPESNINTDSKSFNVSSYGTLYKIEVIPIRIQEVEKKKRLISCTSAKSEETLTCS